MLQVFQKYSLENVFQNFKKYVFLVLTKCFKILNISKFQKKCVEFAKHDCFKCFCSFKVSKKGLSLSLSLSSLSLPLPLSLSLSLSLPLSLSLSLTPSLSLVFFPTKRSATTI